MKAFKIIVKGRVQGVYFRAFTQKMAKKLAIYGTVKNCPDGSVEIIAIAEQAAMEKFIQWCHKGPLLAKVSEVILTPLNDAMPFTRFDII